MADSDRVNILLVDDTPANLMAIGEVLSELGQNVVTASSGKEALKILLQQDFALILLDINMPGMNGFETASLIRQRKNSEHTPIIFITAHGSEAHRMQSYSLGAVDYIFSPVVPEVLKSKVSVFVELHRKTLQIGRLNRQLKEYAADLERKVAERTLELSRANEELTRLNRIKSDFTSMVSHELRTPLSSIKAGIDLVLDGVEGPLTAEQSAILAISKANVDRLAKLIENVLNFSRLEAGKIDAVLERGSLRNLILEVCSLMKPIAQKKGLALLWDLPEDDLQAVCDADMLKQLVINLIDNAVKFTPKGGWVSVKALPSNGAAVIEVEDTGAGIAPEDQDKIFEMFTRAAHPQTLKGGGAGIGLAICRQIARLHNGALAVESEPGKGTKFSFTFPRGLPAAAPIEESPSFQPSVQELRHGS
ncbi:MAG TPA: ATP-binding protein [bacterium]|nr:ATP-binding protein [bacterium]